MRRRHHDLLRVPREGSCLRRVYDAMLSGETVSVLGITRNRNRARDAMRDLRDFYNCEIVSFAGCRGGCKMLGRWDGEYFVPVERLSENAGQ